MEIKLRGHKNRHEQALKVWLQMKLLYDNGLPVKQILEIVRKPDGTKYRVAYFYQVLDKLAKI